MSMDKKQRPRVSEEKRALAARDIGEKQKEIDFSVIDYPVEVIVEKFKKDDFYVPDYQRNYIWRPAHKSKFIESVILGLPIPMMFLASMEDGRYEIVDGAQRTQTLEEFVSGDLKLGKLDQLPSLQGFRFADLPPAQQRKFLARDLRLVVLQEDTTVELRQEIFGRVNTTGVKAKAGEVRRGAYSGPFMTMIAGLADRPDFQAICPVSESLRSRREPEELVLRFFAYSDRYKDFKHDVAAFLDDFVEDHREGQQEARFRREFNRMVSFVEEYFPYGCAKTPTAKTTPRVRFEAIAVGVNLALRESPDLVPGSFEWLSSPEFERHTTTHASNSQDRLAGRVEYVRDMLLESGRGR
jgi:hypothetical protein